QARALDHTLHKQSFDQSVGQGARYGTALHGAAFEGAVNEDSFKHAGGADEIDKVCFSNRAAKGLEALSYGQFLPVVAAAQCGKRVTHHVSFDRWFYGCSMGCSA